MIFLNSHISPGGGGVEVIFNYQYFHIYNYHPTGLKGSRHCILVILPGKNIFNNVLEYFGPKIQLKIQNLAYFFMFFLCYFPITHGYPTLLSICLHI